jgi:NAD+ kinase
MKLAIFGKITERTDLSALDGFFAFLKERKTEYLVHYKYSEELERVMAKWEKYVAPYILTTEDQLYECNFAFSFGGDGTFLNTAMVVRGIVPVLGINFGRLGFLTTVTQENLIAATSEIMKDMYRIDLRWGIEVDSNPSGLFGEYNFGLNDFTIHKSESNEMITVHTYINGEFLNSYWGDGLIIATPTGSTAYSLSCGGPIIHPSANSLVLTPVAPHSLTVRPMILADNSVISFGLVTRAGRAMVSLDTRTVPVNDNVEIAIRKSKEPVKMVRVQSGNYLDTLRGRLMWGNDNRNWRERMNNRKL